MIPYRRLTAPYRAGRQRFGYLATTWQMIRLFNPKLDQSMQDKLEGVLNDLDNLYGKDQSERHAIRQIKDAVREVLDEMARETECCGR